MLVVSRTLVASAVFATLASLSCAIRTQDVAVRGVAGQERLHDLPTGLGRYSVEDAVVLLEEIGERCGENTEMVGPWHADLLVRGFIGRTSVEERLRVAFNPYIGGARIERLHGKGRSFVLVSEGTTGTKVVLDDGERVLTHDRFDVVLNAIGGLELGATALEQLIRGCYMLEPPGLITSYGDNWRRVPGGRNGTTYFHREVPVALWRMAAMFYPGPALEPRWRMDYHDVQEGIPRTLLITGMSSGPMQLQMTMAQVGVRASLPSEMFRLEVRPSSRQIKLDELTLRRLFAK
jgi:hypothetical protein